MNHVNLCEVDVNWLVFILVLVFLPAGGCAEGVFLFFFITCMHLGGQKHAVLFFCLTQERCSHLAVRMRLMRMQGYFGLSMCLCTGKEKEIAFSNRYGYYSGRGNIYKAILAKPILLRLFGRSPSKPRPNRIRSSSVRYDSAHPTAVTIHLFCLCFRK